MSRGHPGPNRRASLTPGLFAIGVLLFAGAAHAAQPPEKQKEERAEKHQGDAALKEMRVRFLEGPEGFYHGMVFSPDGKLAAAGVSQGATVSIWEVGTGKEKARLQMPDKNYGYHLAFSADGRTLVSEGREDRMFRFWDVATGKQVREIEKPGGRFLALSSRGKFALLGSSGAARGLHLVETATGKMVWQAEERFDHAVGGAFSPDGKLLAVHTGFGEVYLCEAQTGNRIRTLREKPRFGGAAFGFVHFSADGKHIASGGHIDKHVRILEVATGKERFRGDCQGFFCSASFSPSGPYLATGSTDGLMFYDLTSDKEIGRWRLGEHSQSVVFSPDGSLLAIPGKGGVFLYAMPRGQAQKPPERLPADELEALWKDLGTENDFRLQEILTRLRGAAQDSVPFLNKKVQPMAAERKRHVEQLISALDEDEFTKRDQAMQELQSLAALFEPLLTEARKQQAAGETRNRLTFVLKRLKETELPRALLVDLRAVGVLEQIGSAEARKVLETLAAGAAGARLTVEAEAALQRHAKRPGGAPRP
ncbi:MAG TPA: WD40 repeat domain-containing protein [Gemmataceae bacterium]|nr:WD40 repeat domain-containing protein [Gemmataceae bacterium]